MSEKYHLSALEKLKPPESSLSDLALTHMQAETSKASPPIAGRVDKPSEPSLPKAAIEPGGFTFGCIDGPAGEDQDNPAGECSLSNPPRR